MLSIASEVIGDGPMTDKTGRAIVQQVVAGVETNYAIQAKPSDDEEDESFDAAEDRDALFPVVEEDSAPIETEEEEEEQEGQEA